MRLLLLVVCGVLLTGCGAETTVRPRTPSATAPKAAQGGYAALSAELIDPPVTFGDADCAPWMHVCSTRELPGDNTAVITGDNASPMVMVEVYRADKGVPLRLRATREVAKGASFFWEGGTPAAQVPVDVDALVRLAGSLATDPV